MLKVTSKVVTTVAVAGLAFAPIAAQANTRAGDQAPLYTGSTASQPGLGRSTEGQSLEGAPAILIALFAAAAIIGAIVVAASEDTDDTQSPGT
ncbi:MAG: hypothetical protein AAGI28_01135 [Pseudomonadota bacterium]